MRVCQFRHDGKWTYNAAAANRPPYQEDQRFYSTDVTPPVKPAPGSSLILSHLPGYFTAQHKVERRNQIDDSETDGHDQPLKVGIEFSLAAPIKEHWSKGN